MPGKFSTGDLDGQVEMLMRGCEFEDSALERSMRERLWARLALAAGERRPLRVYTGYDPTAADLHLGHSITLRAMRRFQRLGHHVIVVVGTMTALVGDTSDRAAGRPRALAADVAEAARSYAEQAFTILDPADTEVVANGDWLGTLAVPQVLELASTFTVQQFLARDNYKRRVDRGDPVGLHEFLYNAADAAQQAFARTHQMGGQPDVIPEVMVHGPRSLADLLVSVGAASSKTDARRLIAGRGVSLNGQKASSAELVIDTAVTMKVGPRRFYQIVFR